MGVACLEVIGYITPKTHIIFFPEKFSAHPVFNAPEWVRDQPWVGNVGLGRVG